MHLFAAAELGRMLLVVGADLGVARLREVLGQIGDQLLPPHLVAFLDHRRSSFGADGGGDFLRRDLHPVRRRVFREDDLFDVLIEHGAGDLRADLRQIGAGVAVEIALEIGQGDHPLADANDDVRGEWRLSMAGDDGEDA